jgi:hypothetical protein
MPHDPLDFDLRPVRTEIAGKGTPYFELIQFLGCWFGDDDNPLEQTVKDYVAVDRDDARATLDQGRKYLAQTPFPWKDVIDHTNLFFEDEAAAVAWLTNVLILIDRNLKQT